ncbi:DNA double-strand break repair nuclease NurA [Candidatus Leptofilum sp.]|uniref:DNA double-strand break repair nuclease NurA n=1 Tax=Candidatus Leptofilum sp. TaxID=3241576 RepID=UPI003B59776E
MTLEYEKLLSQVKKMVDSALARQVKLASQQENISEKINTYAEDRKELNRTLDLALESTDNKLYAARPHPAYELEPLNKGVSVKTKDLPETAVIIGADGSQIMPDRHAPFLYYLINVGIIKYFHGAAKAPDIFTKPILQFPDDSLDSNELVFSSSEVSVARDLEEIRTLSEAVCEESNDTEDIVLGLLDQRLLYRGETQVVYEWLKALQKVEQRYEQNKSIGLVGFITNPGTSVVINMLRTLDVDRINPDTGEFLLDPETLMQSNIGITDATLFTDVLEPGQRTTVFTNISELNTRFGNRGQDICFFYLNASTNARGRQISRVDMPCWLANDVNMVNQIHALIYSQCKFDYPYVLTRADEIAVILQQDREYFENMIAMQMGSDFALHRHSPKQIGKFNTRSGPSRYE